MACEDLARLLSCLLKRGQSARCCDDLVEFESRLSAELLHWKNSFRWFRFLLLRGTAESGALKASALPGGARRLAVCALKGAQFAFIGAKRETLDRRSGRSRRSFSAGRAEKLNSIEIGEVLLEAVGRLQWMVSLCGTESNEKIVGS